MLNTNPIVNLYIDGASLPTNGEHGGWGAVLIYIRLLTTGKTEYIHKEASGYLGEKITNNQAELLAAIHALELLTKPCQVEIVSDSQYCVKCGNGDWRRAKNTDLWERYEWTIEDGHHSVHWKWVKGHDGNQYNERSHVLAERAALGKQTP